MKKIRMTLLMMALMPTPFLVMAQNTFPSTGNVGIGTTSPGNLLEVAGNAQVAKLLFQGVGGNNGVPHYDYAIYQESAPWTFPFPKLVINYHTGIKLSGHYSYGGVKIYTDRTSSAEPTGMAFSVGDGDQHVRVVNKLMAGDALGVGTTTDIPSGKIQVREDAAASDASWRGLIRSTNATSDIDAFMGNYKGAAVFAAHNYARTAWRPVYVGTADGVAGGGNVYLAGSAQVFIGTVASSPHKLTVEGSIGARRVKVNQSGWPDYVFEPTYQLRSIPELEKFIAQNGHLPEVPSAAEVEGNGLDLGAINAALLKKIEELSLYIIELNKRVSQLENH